MEHFNEELIETTLLWSKKRLGSHLEAEELTQQILCEALTALRSAEQKGHEIVAFFPWYWKLAENQLNIFLRLKYTSAVPIDELGDTLVCVEDVEGELVREDELRTLSRAVSRLSRLHREMIIDYYLREKSLIEISEELKLPLGTIKRRLFDARENVKRSIENMETIEIGRGSYAPAELELCGSLAAPDYHDRLNDLIVKQLLVACRQKPRSIREIADEIAVAPVYFEEKLEYLLKNSFLIETSRGKYLTDIVILPKQLWIDFKTECAKLFRTAAPELRDILLELEDKIRGFSFIGNDLPTGRLMWLGYIAASSKLSDLMVEEFAKIKNVPSGNGLRQNGKDYRYMGFVTFPDERIKYPSEPSAVSWSNLHMNFRTTEYRQITYANLFDEQPFASPERNNILNQDNISLFMQLARDPKRPLNELEEIMCADLIAEGFLEKRDGLYPTLPIIEYSTLGQLEELIRASVRPIAEKYTAPIAALGDRMILPHIRSGLYEEYVNWVMRNAFFPLGYVLRQAMYDAVDECRLELPKNYLNSSLAAAVYFKR